MSNFVSKVISDEFVWDAINKALPRARRSGTSYLNFNCPMCTSRGESQDTKGRCGIKRDHKGLGVHCFNCGFRSRWMPGDPLNKNFQSFLRGLGISDMDVKRLAHTAFSIRRLIQVSEDPNIGALAALPYFKATRLPSGAASLEDWARRETADPDFLDVANYLYETRGETVASATTFYWTPATEHGLNRRLIVPFYYDGSLVGWTARAIDKGIQPRYWSEVPSDFLFNSRVMGKDRKYLVVCEGVFDALAIDGIATLGAKISPVQAAWINRSGMTPVLVADRDRAGGRMIDLAVFHGWSVAFPKLGDGVGRDGWWDKDVKDLDEAVRKYGRLYTMRSIISTMTDNKTKIQLLRKYFS